MTQENNHLNGWPETLRLAKFYQHEIVNFMVVDHNPGLSGNRDGRYVREDLCIQGETLAEVREHIEVALGSLKALEAENGFAAIGLRAALAKLDPARAQGEEG